MNSIQSTVYHFNISFHSFPFQCQLTVSQSSTALLLNVSHCASPQLAIIGKSRSTSLKANGTSVMVCRQCAWTLTARFALTTVSVPDDYSFRLLIHFLMTTLFAFSFSWWLLFSPFHVEPIASYDKCNHPLYFCPHCGKLLRKEHQATCTYNPDTFKPASSRSAADAEQEDAAMEESEEEPTRESE
jgi:hypothetical protein